MNTAAELDRLERIIDSAGVCEQIETLLPAGIRPRQLRARTLLIGMLLVAVDGRPAHLRRVHRTLLALSEDEQKRLGVQTRWRTGWHRLTYRQLEYTFALVTRALAKHTPDGTPSELLSGVLDRLLEASVQTCGPPASSSYAVDWTDLHSWARPPASTRPSADPEAGFGHRTSNHPAEGETFYGYYLQALTTVRDENGPQVPELVRRIQITGCQHDPPTHITPVLERMHQQGIKLGDLLADSGYSYRQAQTFALPTRQLGIQLIIDLHPNDRGRKGTHMGATCSNGNLYCPATPTTLLELSPLARGATNEQAAEHDHRCQELTRYKLQPLTAYDPDGYRRVICPAAANKIRCPLRPDSMTLPHEHPTILTPPEHPPVCCTQKTITVPPSINAKTAQKHDYPSPAHRRSYTRRTGAERTFATTTDRATTNLSRGFCRLLGLTPIALFTATAFIARNLRINDAFNARQAENERRAANGLPPKRRKRRRQTTHDLTNAANPPP